MKTRVFTVCVVIFLFLGIANAGISDGLVAYYPFNGNANDESGNGNNGTVNGATLATGRFGIIYSSYSFDGNDYIAVADSQTLKLSTEFSISVWIKLDQILENKSCIIGKFSNITGESGPEIKIHDNSYLVFEMSNSWSTYIDIHSDNIANLFDGKFHHIVCLRNSDKLSKIYYDGIMIKSGYLYNDASNNQSLVIGTHSRNVGTENFKGIIDDIRIYKRALSASEVQQLYQEQGACQSGVATKPYTFTAGTPAKATEVNANFDTIYTQNTNLNCQVQALKAIVCQDHPTASLCQ